MAVVLNKEQIMEIIPHCGSVCVQRRYDMSALPKQDGGRLFA